MIHNQSEWRSHIIGRVISIKLIGLFRVDRSIFPMVFMVLLGNSTTHVIWIETISNFMEIAHCRRDEIFCRPWNAFFHLTGCGSSRCHVTQQPSVNNQIKYWINFIKLRSKIISTSEKFEGKLPPWGCTIQKCKYLPKEILALFEQLPIRKRWNLHWSSNFVQRRIWVTLTRAKFWNLNFHLLHT